MPGDGDAATADDKENGASMGPAGAKSTAMDTAGAQSAGAEGGAPAADGDAPQAEDGDDEEDEESEEESEEEEDDGMTEYERQRQRNIQRNRELMMQLSLKKMADNIKPDEEENAAKKRGPKKGWKKNRGPVAPSRGSSRIQRLQEERKHTAWKDLRVDKPLKTHPNCYVELAPQCLGIADNERRVDGSDGIMIPGGYFAEGEFMSETLYCWTDMLGKHFVAWGEAEGDRQRHVETEDGGSDTAAGAALCILRELQRRKLELFGAIPGRGVSEPTNIRMRIDDLPTLYREPEKMPAVLKPLLEAASRPVLPPKRKPGRPPKEKKEKLAKTPKTPKTPKSVYGAAKFADVPDAPECHNCGVKREQTQKMRFGPSGAKTLCNACGLYWATQGRNRPNGVFKDDYERKVPEGQVPAVAYTRGFRPDTISRAYNTVAVGNLDEKKSPMDSAEKKEPEEGTVVAMPDSAEKKEEDGEDVADVVDDDDDDDDEPLMDIARKVDEDEEDDDEDVDDEEEEEAGAEQQTEPTAASTPAKDLGRGSFFQNMVKMASVGIVTPAMIGADDFPAVLPVGFPAPRWAPHLTHPLPPLLGMTEDSAYEVKTDPQNSKLAKAIAVIADSDPIKDAQGDKLKDYPDFAWYAVRTCAAALSGWGATVAGVGPTGPCVFPTRFTPTSMAPTPRVYVERDVDGLTLFGYAEPEVQQALEGQMEKYEQKAEVEGPESEEAERKVDLNEALAFLDTHVKRAMKVLQNADNRADRDAKYERAAPRVAMASEAKILCPPLPNADKSKKTKGKGGAGVSGASAGDDSEQAGFLTEDAVRALPGQEEVPEPISVVCGTATEGVLLPYCRPREEKIQINDNEETIVTPAVYERMGGMGASKKWRKSIRLANNTDKHLGNHLAELGAVKGESVVGRRIAIYWVDDKSFYLGVVDSFTPQTGEHGIKYDDGEIEDLFLPMQRIKWLSQDVGPAGFGQLKGDAPAAAEKTQEQLAHESIMAAAKAKEEEAAAAEARRIEEEAKGILSPEGRNRMTLGAFDVWVNRPLQWRMKNSERRKCFEILQILRSVPDPDDDPDDEDEPPRLLIEPFDTLPTPRELPDYYEIIRCPMDCRCIERVLKRPAERSFASPWMFAVAVELMLTNAQIYNDEDSQIHEEAGIIRRAFVKAMEERFPNQPLPRPFKIYETVDEPMWMRPWGWTAPQPEDVADEADPFGPLDWEQEAKDEDEERALARAMKAGAAMYGGAPVVIAKPKGRPPGRPRKEDPGAYARDDTNYDPKSRHGVSAASRGNKRKQTDLNLGPAATAAKDALDEAAEALTLDELVEAAESAKAPELAGARRPGSTMLSILRQHPDIFVESLTGNGAVFSINERLVEYSDDDEPAGPARKPTTRAKPKKSYADPDEDDFDDHDAASPDHHGGKRKREEPHYDGLSPQQTEACKNILKKVKELKDRDGRQVAELFILLPTRKQLPDYYKQIAHPIDFDSIGKCLNKQGGYQTVWKFLLACELMLSNAQVYNEEHSELWEDAATLRKAFIAELKKVYPGHPYPKPMSVYDEEECQEPEWNRPEKKSGGMKVVVKAGGGGAAAQGLKVKMHNAGKGDALKVTMHKATDEPDPMPAFEDCGKCATCTMARKSRAHRCLEVQMKEQLHLGHEGAKVAAKGAGAKGMKLEIYWPGDDSFYSGQVVGFDAVKLEHKIKYDAEGEEEHIALWGPEEVVKVKSSRR